MISRRFSNRCQRPCAPQLPLLTHQPPGCGSVVSAWLVALLLAGLTAQPVFAGAADEQLTGAVEHHLNAQLQAHARQQGWHGLRIEHQHQWLGALPEQPCKGQLQVSGGNSDLFSRQRLELYCAADNWRRSALSQPRLFIQAVHATGNIERGTTLHGGVLASREMELSKSQRGFYSDVQQLQGLEARRRIRAHQALAPSLVKNARLVLRGDQLRIVASQQGIAASTLGEALQDGGEGHVIQVRNLSSNKVIDAMVVEAGVVSSTY